MLQITAFIAKKECGVHASLTTSCLRMRQQLLNVRQQSGVTAFVAYKEQQE
jgi:hypothetical protein